MGGPNASRNFMNNFDGWQKIKPENIQPGISKTELRLAPMTGGEENVGYKSERDFYFDITEACRKSGFRLCIGDGTPDCKIQYGIESVKKLQEEDSSIRAGVFIKPYRQEKIFERMEWAEDVSEIFGIDIDSYNIVTMRNLVHLEKKTPDQLRELKHFAARMGIPFAIKGIFTQKDLELVSEVKPDVIYISNHGGRVDTIQGSTAEFLQKNHVLLKNNCDRLWIDGGIRNAEQIKTAVHYGADCILFGRPIASALCRNGEQGVLDFYNSLRQEKNPGTY